MAAMKASQAHTTRTLPLLATGNAASRLHFSNNHFSALIMHLLPLFLAVESDGWLERY